MPIEIRELHIRVIVNTPGTGQGTTPAGHGESAGGEIEKETVVAECVEQVLQILHGRGER